MGYTLGLGHKAPNFSLLATDGESYSLENFSEAKGVVIFFTCNHCPYVIGSNENTRHVADKFQKQGISFVGINSNSPNTYEADSYPHMKKEMQLKNYPWTYLYDSNQSVARAYGALKTPHFYLFNEDRELIYTGRAVDYPRDASLSKTHELEDALESFLSNKKIEKPLTNPIGCNIKWDGKPPHWMPPEACDIV